MKRFWTEVSLAAEADGFAVLLDARPLRTPARAPLRLPNRALAQALADEWAAVGEAVQPGSQPLTGLANAAIDLIVPDPASHAEALSRYAESDLLCYRAEAPSALVARQASLWEPPLKAAEARHGLLFRRTAGIVHVAQPEETLSRVRALFAAAGPWRLAALNPIVSLSGSAVLGLALLDGVLDPHAAFAVATLDEQFQEEHWGADAEASRALESRRAQFLAACRFLQLCS